jgi:hypothetical protein
VGNDDSERTVYSVFSATVIGNAIPSCTGNFAASLLGPGDAFNEFALVSNFASLVGYPVDGTTHLQLGQKLRIPVKR